MKDLNLSDYLIPASFLIGPAVNLYTYLKKEKTGDKDKDKLINENRKLKRNKLSNTVYGNLGYIASILAAYGYWQNRRSINSHVASLKSMITALQGENSDNAAQLGSLQEDYLTLQARMQNEIVRSETLSNFITLQLMNNTGLRTLRQIAGDFPASHVSGDIFDIYNNPDIGEAAMIASTGTSAIDVYNSMQGEGIIKKWLPSLGLVSIIALLSQQSGNFTNLLNERFKGIHESLSSAGTSIGLTSGDINRLVFDGQVYNNFINLFQIYNDETTAQLRTTIQTEGFSKINEDLRDQLLNKRKQVKDKFNKLNRFEKLKYAEKRELYDEYSNEILREHMQETYTTPPPNLDSMGYSRDPLYSTTPFMVPSEMRELADVNRSLRNLPPIITEDVNRSLAKKLLAEDYPFGIYDPEVPPKLGQEPDYNNLIDAGNKLFSIFPGLILADNYPGVTSPIRERAYYRNLKRFNKDEIFKGISKLRDDNLTTWQDRYEE
jgi:hypothetical protein